MLLSYIFKRILMLIPMVLALSVMIFFIIKLPPGDFLTTNISRMELAGGKVNEGQITMLKRQYGLDKSDAEQYFLWVGNIVFRGDFGRSFTYDRPVTDILKERFGYTMAISLITLVISWGVAIPIGIYSATHKYSGWDHFFTFFGFIGMAVPGFLLALVLIYLIFVGTGVAFTGMFSVEYAVAPWSFAKFLNMMPRMFLAVFIIGLTSTAQMIRTMRAMTLDELEKQYVTTARAKGLEEHKMLIKYPIRMAINPQVSTIGWILPGLISGEVVVSIVLNMPTMGPVMRNAFMNLDMYLAGSMMLFVAMLTILGTLISDILLSILDPRIRFGGVVD
jgi:peptide/nickel transport system permease protein